MPRLTWLTPFFEVWKKEYGGEPAGGAAAKALKPLIAEIGEAEAVARFERYCKATPGRFASVVRFAQTHGEYAADVTPQVEGKRPMTMGRVV